MNPAAFASTHFGWAFDSGVATVTLNRPERKNPLTFASYAELRDTFRALVYADAVKAVIVTGAGSNFPSGGDVHEIIGTLTGMAMPELLKFTRMTGDLVKAMRACPQPIIAALDGVCVGAGAIMAMASDMRLATPETRTAFLFTRVGLAGCDMGACALLPRIVGQGRSHAIVDSRCLADSQAAQAIWPTLRSTLVYDGDAGTGDVASRMAAAPGFDPIATHRDDPARSPSPRAPAARPRAASSITATSSRRPNASPGTSCRRGLATAGSATFADRLHRRAGNAAHLPAPLGRDRGAGV